MPDDAIDVSHRSSEYDAADHNIFHLLEGRPSRASDFAAENTLLGALADALAHRPGKLLQKLTDLLVETGIGQSAGISLRDLRTRDPQFRWVALSGKWARFKGHAMPLDAVPCGAVVRHDAVMLLEQPDRHFPGTAMDPPICELLLVPFHAAGKPVGTLWVTTHGETRSFETEDVRLLRSLARFASASRQVTDDLGRAQDGERASRAALADEVVSLQRLHELYARLAVETDLDAAFRDILAAAVDLTGTDRGVLQLVSADGERLEIAVHHGFGEGTAFTEHFRYQGARVACDAAREHRQRVVIEDIARFPALAGTVDREIALAENIAATQSTPMFNRAGALIGVLNTQFRLPHRPTDQQLRLIDMLAWAAAGFMERHHAAIEAGAAHAALSESEARFRELGKASPDVIWIRDAQSLALEYLSPAFATVYGVPPEPFLGTSPADEAALVHADDRAAFLANLDRLRAGERVRHEFRILRPSDGRLRWIRNTDFPLSDDTGRITRIGGIGQDVTEAKASAGRLGVLMAELQHRTRNIIAVVRAMAGSTMAEADSMEEFTVVYGIRLEALGRVQGLLSRLDTGDRVAFDELVRMELSARGAVNAEGHGPKVELDGPRHIRLRSSAVQTLALALHELATNAAKYGALAQPGGRLRVGWHVERSGSGQEAFLVVDWRERGVVMPDQDTIPRGSGFGRELIEHGLPYELDAETSYVLGPDGVHCMVRLPIADNAAVQEVAHG